MISAKRKIEFNRLWTDVKRKKLLLLMLVLPVSWYVIFCYLPMFGVVIAFKDFSLRKGIWGSEWVGLAHFQRFISHPYFYRLIRNTFLLSIYSMIFSFPLPIILALMINELRSAAYKKIVQTISYLPHFISTVAIVGMVVLMLSPTTGFVNKMLTMIGIEPIYFMIEKSWFRTIYIASGVWQSVGWSAIIYLASLAGVNPELYEAATIDGATRLQRIRHINIPGIKNTIMILMILNLGSMLSVGSEKVLLMYNEMTYETADVISTYIFRVGLLHAEYSYSTAVGLMNSVINMFLLIIANNLSRRFADFSLW